jgi:RNA polymerase sigma-70 factor (ECF subfamily)
MNQPDFARDIRNGERTAEADLVRTFCPAVTAMLHARTRDPGVVPDLVQDVMIAVIQALRAGDMREPDKLQAYIRGVTRNIANSWLRDHIRRSRDEPIMPDSAILAACDPAEQSDRQRMVTEALDTLSPSDREILMKTLVDGDKPGAIAAQMRLGVDVVRQRKSRAVKKVAEYIRNLSRTGRSPHVEDRRPK